MKQGFFNFLIGCEVFGFKGLKLALDHFESLYTEL